MLEKLASLLTSQVPVGHHKNDMQKPFHLQFNLFTEYRDIVFFFKRHAKNAKGLKKGRAIGRDSDNS